MSPSPPTEAEESIRALPFALAGLLAFATVVLPPAPDPVEMGGAAALFAVILVCIFSGEWARPPRWGGAIIGLGYFLVIFLMRDGQGGSNAGYAPMTLLPVFWLALYGTRPQLYLAVAGVALSFAIPLLVGGDGYTDTDLRRGILFTATSAIIGLTVQSLVRRARERSDALAEQRDFVRSILEHLPDTFIMVHDRSLTCVLAEGEMLGRPELTDRTFVGRYALDDLPEVAKEYLLPIYQAALQGEAQTLDFTSPNTGLTYETEMAPYWANGQIVGVLTVARDATARRAADAEIAAANERFVESFRSAPIGMALLGLRGEIVQVNPAMELLLGCDAEALQAQPLDGLTAPGERDQPGVAQGVTSLRSGRTERFQTDERFVHAAGHHVDVALSMSLVRDAAGEATQFITQVLDISERKELEARLQRLAERDPLTGLFNRREFSTALDRHVAAVARSGPLGAVILLDVDRFKRINDTFGHAAGDEVIVGVARLLERSVRAGDIVARLGGDEFALLLPEADAAAAEVVARRLVEDVRGAVPVPGAGDGGDPVTLSVGVALVGHEAGVTSDTVLEDADRAMYRAKQAGRDGYAIGVAPH